MPEKHDLSGRHSRGKGTRASGQSCVLQWRTFMAESWPVAAEERDRRNDVRHYRLVHS